MCPFTTQYVSFYGARGHVLQPIGNQTVTQPFTDSRATGARPAGGIPRRAGTNKGRRRPSPYGAAVKANASQAAMTAGGKTGENSHAGRPDRLEAIKAMNRTKRTVKTDDTHNYEQPASRRMPFLAFYL